ncbi:MAG: hypothetical protein ACFNVX_11800 [Lachnoanaerobaculum saburreum]|jgi:hypothetical protein
MINSCQHLNYTTGQAKVNIKKKANSKDGRRIVIKSQTCIYTTGRMTVEFFCDILLKVKKSEHLLLFMNGGMFYMNKF